MLLDKIAKVKQINEHVVEARLVKVRKDNAVVLANYVATEIPKICSALMSSKAINGSFPKTVELPKLSEWERRLNELLTNLHADSIKEAADLLKEVHSAVQKIKETWKSFAHEYSQETVNFLHVLNHIFKKNEYADLKANIVQFENVWPIKQANIDQLLLKIEEARMIIASLKVTDTVKHALSRMSTGKATLDDFNEEVIEWVKSNNLSANLRISVIG
ncbi:hypothetical protein [Paenibacillus lautus]|uniref:Uncharacterized protein n=1 Tax=Paenibacillus lautus TaxID=1401 RepID=A0A385TS64_PAELA|nr:hypothetical protein [Paenibacillus lautus]AYB46271.1 hypothetical protein D5F53_24550 [Paenibacillus lautus]